MAPAQITYNDRRQTAAYLAEMLAELKGLALSARFHDLAYLTALAEAEARNVIGEQRGGI